MGQALRDNYKLEKGVLMVTNSIKDTKEESPDLCELCKIVFIKNAANL